MENRKIKVLAVDDNPDNLISIKAMISDIFADAEVFTAQNGAAALEIAASEMPDVILLDVVMPGMDGFEVCRRLKEDETLREIPVVVVTALRDNKESRILALECGAEAFLAKPIDESELSAQIRAMVKIRAATIEKRDEKKRLDRLIKEKSRELIKKNEERKKSEDDLLEAQRLAHIGSFELDVKSNSLTCTDEALNICGIQREDFFGSPDTIIQCIHPDDRESVLQASARAVSEKKAEGIICRIIRPDGEERTAGVRFMAVFNPNGRHKSLRGTVQDITAQKRAEAALKQSEEKFQLLFDKAPLGYQSLDFDGKFIDVNQQWLDTLGYTREEVIGKWFGDFLCSEYIDAFRKRFPVFKAQGFIHSEFEMRKKDGGRITIAFEGKIGYAEDGAFKQTHCILQDITEQKKAQNALIDSEEKYRLLVTQMLQGLAVHEIILDDTGKPADYRFLDVNPSFERITGLKRENIIGKTVLEVLPNIESYWIEKYGQVALTGEPLVYENYSKELGKYYEVVAYSTRPKQFAVVITDITERVLAQNAIEKEREFTNAILESIPGYMYVYDKAGRLIRWNKNHEKMTGYSAEELSKMSLDKWFEGEDAQRVAAAVDDVFTKGYGEVEAHLLLKNGEKLLIRSNGVRMTLDGQQYFTGVGMDISEQRRAEEQLRASEVRYRRLFESAKDGILILDADTGLIDDVNPYLIEMLGFSKEELTQKSIWEIGSLKDIIANRDNFMELQSKGYIRYENLPLQTAKGHYIEVEFVSNVYTADKKNVIQCNIRDVTERKKMEDALRESEKKYSSYIENAPDGVFITDENGNYTEVNKAASEITGYSKEELLNMTIRDITADESQKEAMRLFGKLLDKGAANGLLQYRHKDGSIRWWSLDAVKLTDRRFLGFSKDVTDKKNAEDEQVHLSYHDHLTGLYNRRFFEEELRRLDTKRNLPLSIIMGDINGLKIINDSFGHDTGDDYLKKTAKIIKNACRADDIIARLGGDEFAILLTKSDALEATRLIGRIKDLISKEKAVSLELSVSFGYDTKKDEKQPVSEIMANAENNMYKHKIYEHSSMRSKTIDVIMNTLFEKSNRESQHSKRVSALCEAIAIKLNLEKDDVNQIRIAGLVHDIGKIGIDERILNKPESLSDYEWKTMKQHSEAGWRILSATSEFAEIAQFVLDHHEKYDGSGYPNGLKGDEIPIEARIISISDSFDAMTSERSYRKPVDIKKAVEEIRRCAGTHFDPMIVSVFLDQVLPHLNHF